MEVTFQFQGFYLIIRQKDHIYKSLKVSKYVSFSAIRRLSFSNFEHIQTGLEGRLPCFLGSSLNARNQCSAGNCAKKHKT